MPDKDKLTWKDLLFGYNTEKGAVKGQVGTAVDAVTGVANVGLGWANLNATKEQNKRTQQQNELNSRNAANAYNENLKDRITARRTAGGESMDQVQSYLESDKYKKRKANSL